MKKYQKIAVGFFIFSIICFTGFRVYYKISIDNKKPVVTAPNGILNVSTAATEKDLLNGVTAIDDKSGDVSDTLVVENITNFTDGVSRVITYAAIDEAGNVGRCERVMQYTDYEKPVFSMSGPLRIPSGKSVEFDDIIHASSVLDGDLSDHIKFVFKDYFNSLNTGSCEVEFRVMDSAGEISYLPAVVDVYDERIERIIVNLSDYLIYLPKDSYFNEEDYYVGSDVDGVLDIISNVDTSIPGIYRVDYIVSSNNNVGSSSLIVVVEEE